MIPIVTPDEMGAIDAAAPEAESVLIHRAGGALASAAIDLLGGTYGRRVVVLAGKGNNGNDGRDAAARLRRRGVRVLEVDAADPPSDLPACDLVIDAGFGTGFRGSFEPPTTDAPVLACDIPSGVSGTTGSVEGGAYRAVKTVTFAALKPGLVLEPGAGHAGDIVVADIGLDTASATAHLVEGPDIGRWVGPRAVDDHKWRAATWVVGGSPGMTGAPALAAAAAMRAGSGYARLGVPGVESVDGVAPEVVMTVLPNDGWGAEVAGGLDRFGALVVGPGLGPSSGTAGEVRRLVAEAPVATVVDGDGLRALDTAGPIRPDRTSPVVLTPHDGEFEALAGEPPGADRFASVRALADRVDAVVLLKGPCTIVAEPGGRALAVTAGDARLATAGTGDVLAGVIGAFLARGARPLEGAAAGAFVHARAGALGWADGLVAGDVIDHLPTVLAESLE